MAVEISSGVCDLCGAPSDASLQECNWLTCTYQHCEGGLYHQECLEKYLKSNKLEKNRKTGFKCPRGCGKGTRFDQPCPGRIDKSHPIHPRNEDKKKTKLAAVVVEPQRPAKQAAAAPNGKAAKPKEESKQDTNKDGKAAATSSKTPAAAAKLGTAAATPATVPGQKSARKDALWLPPRPDPATDKQKLAEAKAQLRRELGRPLSSSSSLSGHGSKGDLQGLASSLAGPSKRVAPPAASAWGKQSAAAQVAAAASEPPPPSPLPTMISQLPQFQQLLQQAAAAGKKQQAAAGKTSSLVSSASVPSASSSSSVTQAAPKPAPAVPQPVVPPMPVWPALGVSSQASAAALFSSSSTPVPQTSREAAGVIAAAAAGSAAVRPASPPSAWGSAAGGLSTSQQQQQLTQQAAAQSGAAVAGALASRPHAGSSGSGLASSSSTAATTGPPPAANAAAASVTGLLAASAALSSTAAAAVSETEMGAAAGAAAGAGAAQGSAGTGASSSSSSGQASGWEAQLSTPAAAAPGGSGASSSSCRSGGGSHLVGADFLDDEAKEPKLTKAQKKNLKRAEKKKTPASGSGDQQQGVSGGAGEVSAAHAAPQGPPSSGSAADGGAGALRHGASRPQLGAPAISSTGRAAAVAGSSVTAGVAASRHQRQVSRGSDGPEKAHAIAEAEAVTVMEELCINCIVARKVLALITQLQRLGALEFVAVAAVQRHGSNMLAALEWLLVAGGDAAAAPPEAVLAAAAESVSAAESEVDISAELQQLQELQAAMGVPTELLQQCVVDCNGDVQTAANTAVERMLAAPSGSGSVVAAATPAAGGAARGGVGRRVGTCSGQGNGVGMRGSASSYSVSSLEGAGGAASDSDADAAAAAAAAIPQRRQQQPARSSHFGVRLQDEPAERSSGSAAVSASVAAATGYGVGDAIAAGFVRGGVVLGAAAWPNGYLRDSPPPPGFGPPGSAAGAGGMGGRSTSRLLHWLRDEPGRAAALEEEQSGASRSGTGVGFAADPVVDLPFSAHGSSGGGGARVGLGGYHACAPGSVGHAEVVSGGGAGSNANYAFMPALSKPPSLASQGGVVLRESLGGYGSRWGSLSVPEGARQEAPAGAGLLFRGGAGGGGAAAGAAAAEPDGDNDLTSIMALINVR